jgi:hypothetical protein
VHWVERLSLRIRGLHSPHLGGRRKRCIPTISTGHEVFEFRFRVRNLEFEGV